jgi:Na+-driven multidrug efflux pump
VAVDRVRAGDLSGVLVLGALLLALGQEPEVAAMAQEYLRIAGLGMVPALMVMALKSSGGAGTDAASCCGSRWQRGGERGLNWALIFGNWGAPELGLTGAAIASVGVQVLSLLAVGAYAARCPRPAAGSGCSSGSGGLTGRRCCRCSGWAGPSG